jgi:Antitoxin VbhA
MCNGATSRQPLPPPSRSEAVRFSIASTIMEGQSVSEDMERLLHQWKEGAIDDDELMRRALEPEPALADEPVYTPPLRPRAKYVL